MGDFGLGPRVCLLSLLSLVGCSGPEVTTEEQPAGDQPTAQEFEPSPEIVVPPHLRALPRFVDGGLRCGVLEPSPSVEQSSRPAIPSVPLGGSPPIRATDSASEGSSPACSAPGPWCVVFGPSKTDRENHRLRQEMDAQRRWHEERAARLRTQVEQAQEAADAERRSRLSQLRELGGAAPGIYLTNDDSMSLASPQRLIWAIDHGAPVPSATVRPHELLNYFSFKILPVNPGEVFSVLPELSPHPMRPTDLTLGFSVAGVSVTKETRRNVNLTYVIDRSGSMAGGERIETLKKGVRRSFQELKEGDIVSVVLFDTTTCPLAQNFVVGRDPLSQLVKLVDAVQPRGGSNLQDGLEQGYAHANRSYQAEYSNRVILLTDVEDGGVIDESLIHLSARNYDARRVRLSAVGIGDTVSDELLDRLTEAGKGASMFVSSPAELDAIFGLRFTSLVETVATNVHFKLELPPSISLRAFYGEEASSQKERVQAVHFFSGTKQMYLANLEKSRALRPTDHIRLSIEYDDPETGEPRASSFSWRADELELATGEKSRFASRNLNKARMVATFGYQLRHMADEYSDLLAPQQNRTWTTVGDDLIRARREQRRASAVTHCRRVKGRLDAFSAQLGGEREATRLTDLWHKYCGRYEEGAPTDEVSGAAASRPLPAIPEEKLAKVEPTVTTRVNDFTPSLDDF